VRRDPSASLVADGPLVGAEPPAHYPSLQAGHVAIVLAFFAALGVGVRGIATRGWYLNELGACFLVLGLVAAAIGRLGPSRASERFIEGARDLTETAILVGIALIMEDGQILHTIVHYLSLPLSLVGAERSAIGMMLIQAVLNMIIPTNAILMGILGVAGISYAKWFRFCLPLIAKLYAAGAVVLVLAVLFGFG